MIRVIDLPGFRDMEARVLLGFAPGHPVSPELEAALKALSKATFGIVRDDVSFPNLDSIFDGLDEASQEQFVELENQLIETFEKVGNSDEDALEALRALGVDFADDKGWPIRCTPFFKWQAFAAATKLAGNLPNVEEMGLKKIQVDLEREAKAFVEKRRFRA